MNQKKKSYFSLEFKQNTAQLVLSKGYSIKDAADSLARIFHQEPENLYSITASF